MRVLIVSQYFWPESFRINDLAQGLKERGHTVEVLTGMPNYPGGRLYPGYSICSPARESFHGIPVIRVPLVTRGPARGIRLALNYFSFAFSASLLGALRCRGPYEVIFVFEPSPVTVGLPGIVLKWLRRGRLFFWVQDLWPESLSATGAVKSPWVLRVVRMLVDFIYRRCDRVLVSSEGFSAHVLASGIERRRIVHFPNWAENLYRPLTSTPESVENEMPPGFRVMFAGNIGSAQSFETVVAAAVQLKKYPDIQWVILGDGNMKAWLTGEIQRLGLTDRFHLLGSRPTDTMPSYFSAADVLLVTLRADPVFSLTVPSKIQSYLACGKPVVAALDGEGAAIIGQSGAGISCPAEDSNGLAAAVLAVYEMTPGGRSAMGTRARMFFEANYEREMLIDRLEGWMLENQGKLQCAS